MTTSDRRVLWMTTRATTRGGVGSYLRTFERTPLWERWGIELVSTHRDGTAAQKVLEFVTGTGKLLGRIAVRRPALVHLHMASNGSFARKSVVVAICRAARVPVVLHVHGGGFDEFTRSLPAPLRALVRTTLTGASTVVALGERWAATLRTIAPDARVVVVPNAVPVPGPTAVADPRKRVDVVFLGDVTEQKGVFTLLRAWAAVDPDAAAARLVIAGAGELDRARRAARDLGVEGSVDVRGWVSDAPALLAASQVLVLPSLVEGQPMAVLEAMGRGLCVVASEVGGLPDLVDDADSGLLVPPGDVDALAAALRRVLDDPALRQSLGAGALRRARRDFDVDVVWRRLDALYRELLPEPARTGSRSKGITVNDLPAVPQLRSERDDVTLFESYIRGRDAGDGPVEILEAGCGRRWSLALDGVDFRLTGVDADEAALAIRCDVRRDMDVAIVGDLSTIDLPHGSFDVVYNSFVLEHVRDADQVLANFARWLRPGGVMLLRFPDRHSVRGFATRLSPHLVHVLYYRLVLKYPGAGKPGFPPYPVVYHPTVSREGIRRFCAQHGLTLREEWGDGQHLLLGGKVTERLTKSAMRLFALLSAGRLTARHTNLLYVLEKPATGTAAEPTAAVARRVRPVRLDVVLDTAAVGGVETQLLQLFRAFDRDTVAPRLVCLREPGPLADRFRELGVDVEVVRGASSVDPRRLTRLVSSMRRRGTDVVLTVHHQRAALLLGRVAARLAGAADVVAVHDMDRTAVGDRCLPRSVVETLASSSALILLAEGQGRYLAEHEGVGRFPWRRTREVVIPNGIRLPETPDPADRAAARERLGLAADDVVVGIVARLSAQKAHEVLLRAIARLAPLHPRLRLVVVGDGPRAAELRRQADILGIADRVSFTGVRDDVAALLPGFDVAALSSVHEGAPVTVIEAMAAGLPVVATRCGALPDMVTDGEEGYLVPVGDDEALADRIGELCTDDALRAEMGARGRKRAERDFRAEDMASRYERLLTELAAR